MAHASDTVPERKKWSLAQLLSMLIGVGFIALGGVVLAETGVDFNEVREPHEMVFGLHHTPLLGLAELGFGLLILLGGAMNASGRILAAVLSVVAIGFGAFILVDAEATTLHRWFGVHDRNGWLYLGAGAAGLLSSRLASMSVARRTARRHSRGGVAYQR
jgi:hypothetical protein